MSAESRRERLESVMGEVLEPVRRYLARRTDPATADDVLGEVLLVCWRRIDEVPQAPLPWTYGVARLALANAERGARRQRRLQSRMVTLDPPGRHATAGSRSGEHDPATTRTDAEDAVVIALDALPPGDAEVLRLWAWEELGAGEMAVVLEISPGAAAVRLHRAKEKLRVQLGHDVRTPGDPDMSR